MNNSTYLFGSIGGRFYQMPHDYLNSVLSDLPKKKGPLEKVCGYRSTIKILFCPFIKLNNG